MSRTAFFWVALFATFFVLTSEPVMAQRRSSRTSINGSHQFGFGVSMVSPSQDDLNTWISGLGVVGTKELGSGYEFSANYEFRFDRSIYALHFRPLYMMQSASGGGIEANVSGIAFFPMLRIYPLENDFIRFFFQVGLGYGNMTVDLKNSSGGSGTYRGGNFGAVGGLGAYFCITDASCIVAEGTFRYLPMQRLTGNGSGLTGGSSKITQQDGELEINGLDLQSTMSGVQGTVSYQFLF